VTSLGEQFGAALAAVIEVHRLTVAVGNPYSPSCRECTVGCATRGLQPCRAVREAEKEKYRMDTWKVNKNGQPEWYTVEAETAQEAVEKHFCVRVYHYNDKDYIQLFSTPDEEELQLYAGFHISHSRE